MRGHHHGPQKPLKKPNAIHKYKFIDITPPSFTQNYYKNAPFAAINRVDETHAHYTLPVWLYTRISEFTSIYSLPVIHDASSIEPIYARWWVLLRARAAAMWATALSTLLPTRNTSRVCVCVFVYYGYLFVLCDNVTTGSGQLLGRLCCAAASARCGGYCLLLLCGSHNMMMVFRLCRVVFSNASNLRPPAVYYVMGRSQRVMCGLVSHRQRSHDGCCCRHNGTA